MAEDVEEELAADAGLDNDNKVDKQVENALAAATAVEKVVAVGLPRLATAALLA